MQAQSFDFILPESKDWITLIKQMPKLLPLPMGKWLLLEDWHYTALDGERHTVPAGFVTDLDSVPRIPIVYALYKGRIRAGALLHDWKYRNGYPREKADRLLIEVGELLDGVEPEYLDAIYTGVRAFGWTKYKAKQNEEITILDGIGWGGSDSAKKALEVETPATAQNTIIPKTSWVLPTSSAAYVSDINNAEQQNGIPSGLLGRLLYQESRFRPDIISGDTKSSAGAVGIAQIVPRWHPDVDPTDPKASISYAGRYLAKLKKNFGSWETALAAYNWGWGNVTNAKQEYGSNWLSHAPTETQNYVSQIWGDIA